jgi:transposase
VVKQTVLNLEVIVVYLFGIDIAKYKHECYIVTESLEPVFPSFQFENNRQGFEHFIEMLSRLDPTIEKRIGLEATGHYASNLKFFLQSVDLPFMEINPLLLSRFRKATTLRRSKTDKCDAKLITQFLATQPFLPYPPQVYHMPALKSLLRFRDKLVRTRSDQLVQLTNVLDIVFPEFKPFFKRKFSQTALYILRHYPSVEKISRMNQSSFEKISNTSRGKFTYAQFVALRNLAKGSIGQFHPALCEPMISILTMLDVIETQIKRLDQQIEDLSENLPLVTDTIPGISRISALTIWVEFGGFLHFDNAAQCLAFAGLEPSLNQSGEAEQKGKMVKRGSGILRYTLMNVSLTVIKYNPVFYDFYLKKRNEGKPHRVALTHVVKKLLRVIYQLETKQQSFDASFLR